MIERRYSFIIQSDIDRHGKEINSRIIDTLKGIIAQYKEPHKSDPDWRRIWVCHCTTMLGGKPVAALKFNVDCYYDKYCHGFYTLLSEMRWFAFSILGGKHLHIENNSGVYVVVDHDGTKTLEEETKLLFKHELNDNTDPPKESSRIIERKYRLIKCDGSDEYDKPVSLAFTFDEWTDFLRLDNGPIGIKYDSPGTNKIITLTTTLLDGRVGRRWLLYPDDANGRLSTARVRELKNATPILAEAGGQECYFKTVEEAEAYYAARRHIRPVTIKKFCDTCHGSGELIINKLLLERTTF